MDVPCAALGLQRDALRPAASDDDYGLKILMIRATVARDARCHGFQRAGQSRRRSQPLLQCAGLWAITPRGGGRVQGRESGA
jgi:hypothetical protein